MTENAAVCTHMIHNDPSSSGTTGPPAVTVEVKLLDVPAMGYTSEDKPFARGELCCRGENSFKAYYKGAFFLTSFYSCFSPVPFHLLWGNVLM